jgi:hypothetical protein
MTTKHEVKMITITPSGFMLTDQNNAYAMQVPEAVALKNSEGALVVDLSALTRDEVEPILDGCPAPDATLDPLGRAADEGKPGRVGLRLWCEAWRHVFPDRVRIGQVAGGDPSQHAAGLRLGGAVATKTRRKYRAGKSRRKLEDCILYDAPPKMCTNDQCSPHEGDWNWDESPTAWFIEDTGEPDAGWCCRVCHWAIRGTGESEHPG